MRLPRDGAASFLFFFCFLIVFPEHHGSFLAQASPAGHELQFTAYGSIVEQEEQQQEGRIRCDEVARNHSQRSRREQRLVGKAELHAEEQRKVHSHPRQVAVKAHLKIFAHQGSFAHHVTQVGHVESARELEGDGDEDIQPRL